MRKKEDYYTKKNSVRKKYLKLQVRIFVATLIIIGFIGLLIPLRPKKSDFEKRDLTKFPKFTISSFASGEFFNGISTWYADTFPFRERISVANAKLNKYYGITTQEFYGDVVVADDIPDPDAEITTTPLPTVTPTEEPVGEDAAIHAEPEKAGTIYIAEDRGFELYGFSRDGADAYINMINTAASQLKGKANVYDILVPISIGVNLDEENQKKINSSSQEDTFAYVYGHLDSSIIQVPVMDELKKHNSEYLYFKTDHHWTADGAYYAYKELMKAMNKTPSPLSAYTKNEYEGFLGSFYSYSEQSETLKNNPDTVVTYTPQVNNMIYKDSNGEECNWFVVADPSDYSAANKYLCFIGGDQPYSKIENPNITDGSSCVVIKESYGNCFVPFLVNSFQTVHVIDYRYFSKSLATFVEENNVQNVIYINNANALLESAVRNMNRMLY